MGSVIQDAEMGNLKWEDLSKKILCDRCMVAEH